MKYPVMNLRPIRLGGMLEDYQNEINSFKEKLQQINPPNPGAYGYPPSNPNETGTTGPGEQGGAVEFPNRFAREFPYRPPAPGGFGAGAPPAPGVSVTGGIPMGPPTAPELPPLPPQTPGKCDAGYSWIAGVGCVKDTPSNPDRPPMGPTIPVNPGPRKGGFGPGSPELPGTSVATGIISEPAPPPKPPPPPVPTPAKGCPEGTTQTPSGCLPNVASPPNRPPANPSLPPSSFSGGECPPGTFFDGRRCRGSIASGGGISLPGEATGAASAVTGFQGDLNPGTISAASFAGGIGQVRLVGPLNDRGPLLARPIRLVSGRG